METAKRKTTCPRRGLVLGKFAPLHKGHQLLIETALKKSDETYCIIYNCPETIGIPLNVRAGWLRKLYPSLIVIEGWDGPTETGRAEWIKKKNEKYILKVLPRPITEFFSSEWYGGHVSKALRAENITVDEKRKKYPVSGTMLRGNPHRYRKYMNPYVYKDFIKKAVFLGAESTGKSTIARELAKIYRTKWMPEYGRRYWLEHKDKKGLLSLGQLEELAKKHLALENKKLLKSSRFLFIDTNAMTTELYSRYYHGRVAPGLKKMANLSKDKYHHWFVCDTDIPYEEDGTRNGEKRRQQAQKEIIKDLKRRGIDFTLLRGSLPERIKKVKEIIEK